MVASADLHVQNEVGKGHKAATKGEDVKLEGAELLEAIKKQVEYYFSKENLTQDQFLVSKMDKEYYVEMSVIAGFHLLKVLTANEPNEALIVEAIKNSHKVVMDDARKKVKPANIHARTTLILRNIPTSAAEGEVAAFLTKAKMPTLVGIRSDVGDNWFATFESEEAAKLALEAAKGLKWDGKNVGCALKSENLLKGITPGTPPSNGHGMAPMTGYYTHMQYQGMPFGYGYQQSDGQGGFRSGGRGQGNRRGPGGPEPVKEVVTSMGLDGADAQRRGAKKGKGRMPREGGRDGRDNGSADGTTDSTAAQQPPINLSEFPSLVTSGKKAAAGENTAVKGSGQGEKRATDATQNKAEAPSGGSEQPRGPAPTSSEPSGSGSGSASTSDGASENGSEAASAPAKKKLSYAQMAQLSASATTNSSANASANTSAKASE